MKIILSPAKKMNINSDVYEAAGTPALLDKTNHILAALKAMSYDELKLLWNCNEKIARDNYDRLKDMDLHHALTPAILAYEGIAYQHIAPMVLEKEALSYIEDHLRILSAFYGVLRPMDAILPYRLEMQARLSLEGCKDLYEFWGRDLYQAVRDDSGIIINLASKEYYKCVEKYLQPEDHFITINFVEEVKGKMVTKGTYAKMARGEMVRFMAEQGIEDLEGIKGFDRLGYVFREDLSSEGEMVFERREENDF